MQISAAVLRSKDGAFQVEELELGAHRANEILVRMVATGMCHTDVLARELPPEYFPGPIVYGHEGAGVVEAVGDEVTAVVPGDHVVLSFSACGECRSCARSHPAYCLRFAELNMIGHRHDGSTAFTDAKGEPVGSHYFGQSSFGSYAVVSEDSVVPVDKSYDLARLGPLGCGVQTGAGAIFNVFGVAEGESVVVAGAGSLGLSAVMAAKIAGADPIVAIDLHDSRLRLAEKYGATVALRGDLGNLAEAVRAATGGGCDYALDTTGNAGVVRALHDGLDPIGTLALCGVGFGDVTLDFTSLLTGRTLICNIEGDADPSTFIPHLAQLNAEGRFPFHELITTFPLARINEAERASASGEVIKPVLTF